MREWLLFVAAAVLPALGMGILGFRALRNEESAVRREAAVSLSSSAQRAIAATNAEIDRGSDALTREAFESVEGRPPDPHAWYLKVAKLTPACAMPVVVSPSGVVVEPAAESARPRNSPPNPKCDDLVNGLDGASVDQRTKNKSEIVVACPEARDLFGRWLWPSFALESLALHGDAALARRLGAWLAEHASQLRAGERAAALADIDKLGDADRRVVTEMEKSLGEGATHAASVAKAVRSDAAVRAIRAGGGDQVSFRGGGAVGTLRTLDQGWLVGFVVTPESLGSALAADAPRFGLDPDVRAEVTRRDAGASGAPPTPASSGDKALEATEWLAEGIGVKVSLAAPEALRRRSSRSELLLATVAAVGGFAAVVLVVALFARMRSARRTSELRTSFVAAVSHELRTPIASIRMLSELLEEGRVEEDERGEVYEALAKESRRLGETVDRLLGFSRMAAGKLLVDLRRAKVAVPVDRAVERFRERNPGVEVVCRIDGDVEAEIDEGQIELCVDNLLGNAKKYAPEGAPYSVSVARESGSVKIGVADRGPGISRRDQSRIFEAFERVDDRLSKATEGSGIGLSLVMHAARAHGGRAGVESEPGKGALFYVTLPALPAASSSESPRTADRTDVERETT